MKLTSPSISDGQPLPPEFAFCVPDAEAHVTFGTNKNPALEWSEVPEEAKSLVLICHDPDVPSVADDVNQEGRTIPDDLLRIDFFHWVLVDLRADAVGIQEGEFSDGVTEAGKDGPAAPRSTRQGLNDYTEWFAEDDQMAGNYFGYDGPCPPWNDSIVHHYHFTLYALSVERCPVGGEFTGPGVLKAIENHIVEKATLTGTYTLNPDLQSEE